MNHGTVACFAGGTAGHVHLAVSVAEAVTRIDADTGVLFFGAAAGVEAAMLSKMGWDFVTVPGRPFQRVGPRRKIGAIASAVAGFWAARRVLQARGVTSAIGFGGYASVGATMAARSLGIPTAIMEPNAECGMANRLLRPFVDLVFLGWEECDDGVDPRRRRVHGVPVRMGIEALRERYHAPPGSERASRILLMAGWEDSTRFNEITMSLVRTIRDAGVSLEVRHQTGPTDVASIRDQWREVGIAATAESWFDSITDALDWADFIIARPGASTVAETALTGRPALFVPLPTASEDHQSRNAELIARHGGALWSRETSWCTRELAASIASTLSSPDEWRRCAERARGALSPGASERIARDLLSAAL